MVLSTSFGSTKDCFIIKVLGPNAPVAIVPIPEKRKCYDSDHSDNIRDAAAARKVRTG